MQTLFMVVAALVLVTLAGYAQVQIPRFTRGRGKIMLTRAILVVVGIAFGLLGTVDFDRILLKWLAFLIGFGLVHLPAAVILFIKRKRGTGKS